METFFGGSDNRTEEQKAKLRVSVIKELREALGERWVTNDPIILDTYAWQYIAEFATGTNYIARPLAVALPGSNEDIIEIIKICNRLGCQYKAFSTGFGAWSGVIKEDMVVQIDLKRMDHIIEIDEKNMYAVIEPYVTGNQLQTEAMKLGLNTHIAGVGGQASVLASATSMMGQGWDGISLGFSDRNLLGVEWILPDGRVAQLGSFDACGEYYSGDGPGFSLRGAMRGFGGAMGGLGVFTKCAVKLYPWYGPNQLDVSGTSPNYWTEVPKHSAAGVIMVNSWDEMANMAYKLGEAEILDLLGRNAPSLVSGVMTMDNNEFAEIYKIPFFHEMYYALMFVLVGRDKEDYKYRVKTLKKLIKETNGGLMISGNSPDKPYWLFKMMAAIARNAGKWAVIKSLPGFLKLIMRDIKEYGIKGTDNMAVMGFGSMVRSNMNMRGAFKYGGSFHTSMGSLVAIDNAVRGARIGKQIKQRFIDTKVVFDDGADNAWGGVYEGGAYAHLEELAMYDPRDEHCRTRIVDFLIETNMACIEHHCGDPINAIGPPNHLLYSPACMNYDDWQQKIKAALDPNDASDATMYTDPSFAENPPEVATTALGRVMQEKTKIEID